MLDRARIIADDTSVIKQAAYFNYQNEYTGSDTKKPQVNLQAFQIHLAHHCNLNCASCYVFSSIADKEFPDFDEMDRDLKRISELTHAEVNEIVVSGGEPLLNKDINDYLTMVRKHFPETNIKLITNGLLVKKMPESFWETCAREDIEIYPTQYRVKVDWDYFRKKCIEHQIRYDMSIIRDNFGFQKLNMDWRGRHNARSMFNSCPYSNRCVALENGKLYTCSTASCVKIFNKKFNMHFPENNGIDIYKAKNLQEVLDFLATPIRFCAYCALPVASQVVWQRSSYTKEEWLQCKQI